MSRKWVLTLLSSKGSVCLLEELMCSSRGDQVVNFESHLRIKLTKGNTRGGATRQTHAVKSQQLSRDRLST